MISNKTTWIGLGGLVIVLIFAFWFGPSWTDPKDQTDQERLRVSATPYPYTKVVDTSTTSIGMTYSDFEKLCGTHPTRINIYESSRGTTVIEYHAYGNTRKIDPTGSKGCTGTFRFFNYVLESIYQ